jgi:hypothetical protein
MITIQYTPFIFLFQLCVIFQVFSSGLQFRQGASLQGHPKVHLHAQPTFFNV